MLAQIETVMRTAQEGATMGGQAILVVFVLVLIYAVVAMNRAGAKRVDDILAAGERQRGADLTHHTEVVETFRAEREAYQHERAENFQTVLRISQESARGLESAAAAIQAQAQATLAQVAATNSLRDTMHAVRNELNDSHVERLARKEST